MSHNAKWNKRFIELARHVAGWSRDPSSKVGCVIVNDQRIVLGMGYNGFPRGVKDDEWLYTSRQHKYSRIVHAEANAILNAAGPVRGATMYCTHFPCDGCTKLVIQAGIAEVIAPYVEDYENRWKEMITVSHLMLTEAGVVGSYLTEDFDAER